MLPQDLSCSYSANSVQISTMIVSLLKKIDLSNFWNCFPYPDMKMLPNWQHTHVHRDYSHCVYSRSLNCLFYCIFLSLCSNLLSTRVLSFILTLSFILKNVWHKIYFITEDKAGLSRGIKLTSNTGEVDKNKEKAQTLFIKYNSFKSLIFKSAWTHR